MPSGTAIPSFSTGPLRSPLVSPRAWSSRPSRVRLSSWRGYVVSILVIFLASLNAPFPIGPVRRRLPPNPSHQVRNPARRRPPRLRQVAANPRRATSEGARTRRRAALSGHEEPTRRHRQDCEVVRPEEGKQDAVQYSARGVEEVVYEEGTGSSVPVVLRDGLGSHVWIKFAPYITLLLSRTSPQ